MTTRTLLKHGFTNRFIFSRQGSSGCPFFMPFNGKTIPEMLNNAIYDIFFNDLFGIFKKNAYLCTQIRTNTSLT